MGFVDVGFVGVGFDGVGFDGGLAAGWAEFKPDAGFVWAKATGGCAGAKVGVDGASVL